MLTWLGAIPDGALAAFGGLFVGVLLYLWRRDRSKIDAALAAVRVAVPTSLEVQKAESTIASAARRAAQAVAKDVESGAGKLAAALEPAPQPTIAIHGTQPVSVERDAAGNVHFTIH